MREKLLISACLLGRNCKYNGGNNDTPLAHRLAEVYDLVPVCPECLGGLKIPHEPSDRVGGKVLSRSGADVTEAFRLGAERTLEIARTHGVRRAVMKERSPSCGYGAIYDGTFSGAVTAGDGVAAELLAADGIVIFGESQIGEILSKKEN